MKFKMLLPVTFLCVIFSNAHAEAADTTAAPPTDRETALEEKVRQLESQLEDANRTISDLQNQLNVAGDADTQPLLTEAASAVSKPAPVAPVRTGHAEAASVEAILSDTRQNNARSPASITSLGPEELMLGGVEDVSRLQYLVPGLHYGQTGHDVRLAMRGALSAGVPTALAFARPFDIGAGLARLTGGLGLDCSMGRLSPRPDRPSGAAAPSVIPRNW